MANSFSRDGLPLLKISREKSLIERSCTVNPSFLGDLSLKTCLFFKRDLTPKKELYLL